jgi:uncharacterized membrane protein YdjX (TVP38/TMEM64 family)
MIRWLSRMLRDQVMLLIFLCIIGMLIPWDAVLNHGAVCLTWCRAAVNESPVLLAVGYVLVFITLTGLSIPGPTSLLLAVLGGWLFGLSAIPLSSLSSSTGGSIAFLFSRYWMTDAALFRYFPKLQHFNNNPSWLVLLSMRMNPLIPYFLENLYFGRTRMPLWQFWLVTLIGMLPLTILYVITGTELAKVETYHDLVSWRIVASLVAMSLVPLVAWWWQGQRRHSP